MRYKLLCTLNMDGINYPEGSFIELEDDRAKQLLANGTIVLEQKPFSKDSDANIKIGLDR